MKGLIEERFGRRVEINLIAVLLLLLTCYYWIGPVLALGVPFNVYGYVKDEQGAPLVGASVTVRSPIDQGSATTDSQGRYAVTVSVNGAGDIISVSATHGEKSGSSSGTVPSGSSSMQIDVICPRLSSTITCSASPSTVVPGGSVTVSGSISPAHAATVTLTYKKPDGSTFTRTVSSGSGGSYSDTFTPDVLGTWSVKASWPGDDGHLGAESGWSLFTVAKAPSYISVQVTPSDIRPGASVTISGSINPTHPGASVELSWRPQGGSWSNLGTSTTNSRGDYSYTWASTPSEYGSYEVRASWAGDADHQGASSTASFTVSKIPSTISITLNMTSLAIGGAVSVAGSISPSHPGVLVTIIYTRPDGTKVTRSVTTGTGSDYRDTYAPDRTGTWTVQASWSGDGDHAGASSGTVTLIVKSNPSSITLSLDRTSVNIDEPITVSGLISPPHPGVDVTITLTRPDGRTETKVVRTDSQSHYSASYSPDQAGSWSVVASWPGDQDHADASSPPYSFTVVRRTSNISISLSPPIAKEGARVSITGAITPPHSTVNVTICISVDGEAWHVLASVLSEASGTYRYSWDLAQAGVYMVKTSWEGDRDHEGAISNTITLVVGKTSQTVEAPLPHGGSCTILASSNSSSLSLSVNASQRRICINATGPSGTTGILTVFVPDELLQEQNSTIGDMLFEVDGREVVPQIASITGGYLIALTYSHSTHTIDIYYATYQLIVKVLDHENKPVSSNVVVNITGPIKRSTKTDESGTAVFTKLPIGHYVITAFEVREGGQTILEISGSKSYDLHTDIGRLHAEHQELQKEYDGLKMLFVGYAGASLVAIAVLGALLFHARRPK